MALKGTVNQIPICNTLFLLQFDINMDHKKKQFEHADTL